MKRARSLASAALLSSSLAACSGGSTTTATPTPAPTSAGATSTAAASGTKTPSAGAPSVKAITFHPPQSNVYPTITDVITAHAETVDPDGDGVSVTWRWFINGNEVAGENADTLRPGRWKKNDKVEVEASPRDTKGGIGSPGRAFLKIRNSTPAVTSRPTGSLNGYKAVVQDADSNDPTERFTWTLEKPVPGFTLGADGTLKFDAAAGKAASGQQITIVVTDSAGAIAKQTFDVKF